MNIVRENRDDQTALIKVTVSEADYAPAVDKTLKEYRRKANIPGFRPGMVPMGMVKKMYAKGVTAEESYKAASQAAFNYLEKEKIDYVGDVLPAEEQASLDFENNTDHEFIFEIGIAPEVNLELSAKDKVTRYKLKIDDTMLEGYRSNFLRKYGKLVDVEKVESDEALTGTLDNDQINVEDAYIGLISMSEDERKAYAGTKVSDVLNININEVYKTPSQRATILQVKEDELDGINPEFKFTVAKIRKFAEPEMNEEFFKMAFPDGSVTDEKGLDEYIRAQIEKDLSRETEYLFNFELRKMLLDKANLSLPESFIKRWLFTVNEGKFTMEQIEQDFPQFLDMMCWNMIQKKFADANQIKVTPEDALAEAKELTRMQFAQYRMGNVDDEMLSGYANQVLSNKDEARKIYDKVFEQKVIEAIVPQIKVSEKEVTTEEFGKIADKLAK